MTDGRVLEAIAAQLGVDLGTGDVNAIRRELGALPVSRSARPAAPTVAGGRACHRPVSGRRFWPPGTS